MKKKVYIEEYKEKQMEVFYSIPVKVCFENILKLIQPGHKMPEIEKLIEQLLKIALPIARPKAVYRRCEVTNRRNESLDIDGVSFTNRLFRINLNETECAFPYIITCGTELENLMVREKDILCQYCLDAIKTDILNSSITYLLKYIKEKYKIENLSYMNPGEILQLPLTLQKPLFTLFGHAEAKIGVSLTQGLVMVPIKSSSGIAFPSKVDFFDCQLCIERNCIVRHAPYNPALFKEYEEAIL